MQHKQHTMLCPDISGFKVDASAVHYLADMTSNSSSVHGLLSAADFTPPAELNGAQVTARVRLKSAAIAPNRTLKLRIVFGCKPAATRIRQVPLTSNTLSDYWELAALAPDVNETVALSVEVLDDSKILDSMKLGVLSLRSQVDETTESARDTRSSQAARDGTEAENRFTISPKSLRSSTSAPSFLHPSLVSVSSANRSRIAKKARHRRPRSVSPPSPPSLTLSGAHHVRTRQMSPGRLFGGVHTETAVLHLLTPLNHMRLGWDKSEMAAGRRLVRFKRTQEGNILHVSCERTPQSEYSENDIVVSCIWDRFGNKGKGEHYITSVDIIYLLERLVEADFKVDEKNRIRRNLEGLKPVTTRKNSEDHRRLFHMIMEFPDPKPRTIEKDLKVFKWDVLDQALDKIISKYSLYSLASETKDADSTRIISDVHAFSVSGSTDFYRSHGVNPDSFPTYPSCTANNVCWSSDRAAEQNNSLFPTSIVPYLTVLPSSDLSQSFPTDLNPGESSSQESPIDEWISMPSASTPQRSEFGQPMEMMGSHEAMSVRPEFTQNYYF